MFDLNSCALQHPRAPLSIATDSMALAGFSGTSYRPTSTFVMASMTPDFSRYRWNSSFLGSPPLCAHGTHQRTTRRDERSGKEADGSRARATRSDSSGRAPFVATSTRIMLHQRSNPQRTTPANSRSMSGEKARDRRAMDRPAGSVSQPDMRAPPRPSVRLIRRANHHRSVCTHVARGVGIPRRAHSSQRRLANEKDDCSSKRIERTKTTAAGRLPLS